MQTSINSYNSYRCCANLHGIVFEGTLFYIDVCQFCVGLLATKVEWWNMKNGGCFYF